MSRRSVFCLVATAVITGLLTGCGTTVYVHRTRDSQRLARHPQPVYVTNANLQPEYEMLRASGIFDLSGQPASAPKLTLRTMRRFGQCANPLLLSAMTLGIIPGWLPGNYSFEYDLEVNGQVENRMHMLPVSMRISVWEHLVRSDEQKVLTEALAFSTPASRPDWVDRHDNRATSGQ